MVKSKSDSDERRVAVVPFECSVCNGPFQREISFLRHSSKLTTMFACPLCRQPQAFRLHFKQDAEGLVIYNKKKLDVEGLNYRANVLGGRRPTPAIYKTPFHDDTKEDPDLFPKIIEDVLETIHAEEDSAGASDPKGADCGREENTEA